VGAIGEPVLPALLLRMLSSQHKPSYEEIGTTLGMPAASARRGPVPWCICAPRSCAAGMTPELALGSLR
jgi:hypothetical protein